VRSTGPWDNPNIFGLLMGVGIVLAIGSAVLNFRLLGFSKSDAGCWKGHRRWWEVAFVIVYLVSAGLMGRGLLHSYSRGAWLATFCGSAYLFGNLRHRNAHLATALSPRPPGGEGESLSCASCVSWFNKNWFSLSAILLSVVVLSFWHYRATEWYPARRAFSVTNTLDSTWRDRVAAWECALQITAEHPCFGAGWNQPERLYRRYYFLPEVSGSAGIRLNDYLLLGATLGIPALFCFGMYIWLSLKQKSEVRSQKSEIGSQDLRSDLRPPASDLLSATCRAGAIVLLIGFWFDGGLLRLPTAATFWILLELGAATMQKNAALATDEHRFSQIKTRT
jgi:O-antigen ligase